MSGDVSRNAGLSIEAEPLEQDTITQLLDLDTADGLVPFTYSKRVSAMEGVLIDAAVGDLQKKI